MIGDKDAQDEMYQEEFRNRTDSLTMFSIGLFLTIFVAIGQLEYRYSPSILLSIGIYMLLLMAVAFMVSGFSHWSKAMDQDFMVYEAKKLEKERKSK